MTKANVPKNALKQTTKNFSGWKVQIISNLKRHLQIKWTRMKQEKTVMKTKNRSST